MVMSNKSKGFGKHFIFCGTKMRREGGWDKLTSLLVTLEEVEYKWDGLRWRFFLQLLTLFINSVVLVWVKVAQNLEISACFQIFLHWIVDPGPSYSKDILQPFTTRVWVITPRQETCQLYSSAEKETINVYIRLCYKQQPLVAELHCRPERNNEAQRWHSSNCTEWLTKNTKWHSQGTATVFKVRVMEPIQTR